MGNTDLFKIINQHLGERLQNSELNNSDIVGLIDLLGTYLNLCTISDYAKKNKMEYNSVLARIKSGKIQEYVLFGVKFVIDNE